MIDGDRAFEFDFAAAGAGAMALQGLHHLGLQLMIDIDMI